MNTKDDREAGPAPSRRMVLLAGTSLAVASTLGSCAGSDAQCGPRSAADSGPQAGWPDDLRRQGSGYEVSADPPLRPPAGAPNVLVILLDDVGFGASSAFGGPCQTPTAERLAADGLKYTRFHTTALCSPTRAAMLSGRNHHAVGMGGITEIATSAPGYNSLRPNTCAPLAEILKLNGYSTAQFGKCHEVPVFEIHADRPVPSLADRFRLRALLRLHRRREQSVLPGALRRHDADRAGADARGGLSPDGGSGRQGDRLWIRQQKAMAPDKPFFIYFAPGATHAPHHVPKDWIAKYKGKFDQGWDKLREETFARQKELGVIPPDCELTTRPKEIPAWEETEERLRPVLAREMEIYAAFLEYADHHVGRVIDALADLGILDDTLIYYIIGDNGASAEGSLIGAFNEQDVRRGARPEHAGAADRAHRRPRHAERATTTTPSAGRTRWTRPISGPSRSRRTSAARATARSSIGRTASRPRARSARSSTT